MMPARCVFCLKVFASLSNVKTHLRKVHKHSENIIIEYHQDKTLYKCLEGCNTSYKTNVDLISHLNVDHDLQFHIINMEFQEYEDFELWLNQEQKQNNVLYVKSRGAILCRYKTAQKMYFDCNRSGVADILDQKTRKRKLKKQGSGKLNHICTSRIVLTKDIKTGFCEVTYYETHYGHELQLEYLRLSSDVKQDIASKLVSGMSATQIVTTMKQNNITNGTRDGLLNIRDIHNIKKTYKLENINHPSQQTADLYQSKDKVKLNNVEEQGNCFEIQCSDNEIQENSEKIQESDIDAPYNAEVQLTNVEEQGNCLKIHYSDSDVQENSNSAVQTFDTEIQHSETIYSECDIQKCNFEIQGNNDDIQYCDSDSNIHNCSNTIMKNEIEYSDNKEYTYDTEIQETDNGIQCNTDTEIHENTSEVHYSDSEAPSYESDIQQFENQIVYCDSEIQHDQEDINYTDGERQQSDGEGQQSDHETCSNNSQEERGKYQMKNACLQLLHNVKHKNYTKEETTMILKLLGVLNSIGTSSNVLDDNIAIFSK